MGDLVRLQPGEIVVDEQLPASQPSEAGRRATPDQLVAAWLDAKSKRSGSKKTKRAYEDTMRTFRAKLHQVGLDLDGDPAAVALVAQAWADEGAPEPATYNQRLDCISSCYSYALKMGLFDGNPMRRLDRRPVQAYRNAAPLRPEEVAQRLAAIDRTTPAGLRDYALLAIYLQTGRRLSELGRLTWGDVTTAGDRVSLAFATKGGKAAADQLSKGASAALLAWLASFYGQALGQLAPAAPLWVSLARNGTRGQQISIRAIADICEAHMGTSKVHALRHTFARTMEQAGARPSEIQARLGHSSLSTTSKYLAALRAAENPYGDMLEDLFGIGS